MGFELGSKLGLGNQARSGWDEDNEGEGWEDDRSSLGFYWDCGETAGG